MRERIGSKRKETSDDYAAATPLASAQATAGFPLSRARPHRGNNGPAPCAPVLGQSGPWTAKRQTYGRRIQFVLLCRHPTRATERLTSVRPERWATTLDIHATVVGKGPREVPHPFVHLLATRIPQHARSESAGATPRDMDSRRTPLVPALEHRCAGPWRATFFPPTAYTGDTSPRTIKNSVLAWSPSRTLRPGCVAESSASARKSRISRGGRSSALPQRSEAWAARRTLRPLSPSWRAV